MGVNYRFANAEQTLVYVYDNQTSTTPWNPKLNQPLDRWGGQAYATWLAHGSPAPMPYTPPSGS